MKKIPFNLEYWIRHHPMLETRSGFKVRIVDINIKEEKPITTLISNECGENVNKTL